jgi:ABC-type lipoprotein export system ATPase subunit
MKNLIISNMYFKFSKQTDYFFHNISLTFESGKIYFVQGKNGVGKSTFFSILQGSIAYDAQLSGSITFNNTEYVIQQNSMNPELCSHIKTMLQDSNKMVVSTMTVAENIYLAQLPYYPCLKILAHLAHLPKILQEFNIDPAQHVNRLSGGQKQILAIIMTLQKPTHILLLDEPTAALDDKNSHMIMQFLQTLAKQLDLIVIIITHDKELIDEYADCCKLLIKKENENNRSIQMI